MLKVGDRVRLSQKGKSNYCDSPHNPYNEVGVIDNVNEGYYGDFVHNVKWEGNTSNNYREGELEQVPAELKSLKDHKAKVGDVFRYHMSSTSVGQPVTITSVRGDVYRGKTKGQDSGSGLVDNDKWELVKRFKVVEPSTIKAGVIMSGSISTTNKPDGGPSAYYDFPFKDWTTVNDMIEYLSEKQWGKHSWIFKDILKACTRWKSKDGTTEVYDAKKIIYYGARLLMSVAGKKELRKYLQQLLDDKQFKE